ncbi:MAG: cob(I)yrinic acid a,c-diamide adenosyltransferase [Lachnospiraceae bacterium]|nr:cob(I)yrinic acid a,c-diamide adenosyltransferase [Lachnospiraceae bacterium]
MSGLIHIYEGDGKGKTSAGVGLAVRCAGSGQEVLYTQFLKTDDSSELGVLEQLAHIHLVRCTETFGFVFNMTPETRKKAREFYTEHFRKVTALAREEGVRLLVLDELIASYNLDMVDKEEVLTFLKDKPQELEVVLTGRDPAPELCELADYISRIVKVKHPFDKGIPARKGIEM